MNNRIVHFLGPQRLKPTLIDAVKETGITGKIAVVTAGWQEREAEDGELNEHLEGRAVNLKLYERTDALVLVDRELAAAHRARQDLLRRIQEIHQVRLTYALDAARDLLARKGEARLLGPERLAAVEAVRTLDRDHLERIRSIHEDFENRWHPLARPEVARHRKEIAAILAGCDGLAVAGGHVAVLLNRLRFFGLADLIGDRPVFAWSAGAMALSESVVLFHDNPPQGPGNAEVLDAGLGLVRNVVPLPHARHRLNTEDGARVALFARRFTPASCLLLDDGARVAFSANGTATTRVEIRRLNGNGDVEAWT